MTADHDGQVPEQREAVLLGDFDTIDLLPAMTEELAEAGFKVTTAYGFNPTELYRPGIRLTTVEPIVEALAAVGPDRDLMIPYPADFIAPHQVDYIAEVARLRGARVLVGSSLKPWHAGCGSPTAMTVVMGCRYLLNLMSAVATKAAEPALIDEVLTYLAGTDAETAS